ncbi:MAG TPA: DUF58 domain-containing protein [Mycobacteriales bacterium]|nr:DUF58 domain-containing protein [Mycobacteriales bacterium]
MPNLIGGLLRPLTMRGRCVLAGGVTALIASIVLHERDLLRVAILLVAAPVVAVAMAARTRFRLTCSRRLDPARVPIGDRARVVLRIENISRLPTGLLLIEDTIPYLLGGRPRVVLDRLAPRRPIDVGYHVSGELRGRYRVGPLTVRLMDPFGLCELPRAFATTDTLVVTPHVVTLPTVALSGEWGGAGHSTARSVATYGDDDVATREYRHGDDLRRIHWRTTARRGELTVRREEQPWQSRGAVLLDTRAAAHRGDGPASSLEWAVSAAASISLHLARTGFEVRLITDTGEEVSSAGLSGASFDGTVLDALAVVGSSAGRGLHTGMATVRRQGTEGLLVAVVGTLSAEDADNLARMRSGAATVGIVFVLDADTWITQSPAAAEASAAAHRKACELLTLSGWRTIDVRRGDSLAQLWPQAGRGSVEAFSNRIATATATATAAVAGSSGPDQPWDAA